jgi:hypothetical protein
MSVQVLDVSIGGVLLQSARSLPIGARGSLRLTLGGEPLAAAVEVRRVTGDAAKDGAFRLGAAFVAIRSEHRQMIERFIAP